MVFFYGIAFVNILAGQFFSLIVSLGKFQAMMLQIPEIQRIMNPLSLKLEIQKLKQKIPLTKFFKN